MMTKVSDSARKVSRDAKDVLSVVVELDDGVRSINRSGEQALLPTGSTKVIMIVLLFEVKTFMSHCSNLSWMDVRTKVLGFFVCHTTTGTAPMISSIGKKKGFDT